MKKRQPDIEKLLNKMDWQLIHLVRDLKIRFKQPAPDGDMRELGRRLLMDLKDDITEVSCGLLTARRYQDEGLLVYELKFSPVSAAEYYE